MIWSRGLPNTKQATRPRRLAQTAWDADMLATQEDDTRWQRTVNNREVIQLTHTKTNHTLAQGLNTSYFIRNFIALGLLLGFWLPRSVLFSWVTECSRSVNQEVSHLLWNTKVHYRLHKIPPLELWDIFHNMPFLCNGGGLSPPNPKLEGHPLSAVRDCLLSIFAAVLRIWTPPSAAWGSVMPRAIMETELLCSLGQYLADHTALHPRVQSCTGWRSCSLGHYLPDHTALHPRVQPFSR
jgi:hypothetical protein